MDLGSFFGRKLGSSALPSSLSRIAEIHLSKPALPTSAIIVASVVPGTSFHVPARSAALGAFGLGASFEALVVIASFEAFVVVTSLRSLQVLWPSSLVPTIVWHSLPTLVVLFRIGPIIVVDSLASVPLPISSIGHVVVRLLVGPTLPSVGAASGLPLLLEFFEFLCYKFVI